MYRCHTYTNNNNIKLIFNYIIEIKLVNYLIMNILISTYSYTYNYDINIYFICI